METAQRIRAAVDRVSQLRHVRQVSAAESAAVVRVKQVQSQRFAGTYEDILSTPRFGAAARFFLEELYSDRDYTERDAQFVRIAGALQKIFPEQVAATAVALAELHALTEELDHAMGVAWSARGAAAPGSDAGRYISAWREVGRRTEREAQLSVVIGIGKDMAKLTRTPGLRLLLKMMRGPAAAAGLSSLQHFLEAGFDTFASLAREPQGAEVFLRTIEEREAALIALLFDADPVACETELRRTLGVAR